MIRRWRQVTKPDTRYISREATFERRNNLPLDYNRPSLVLHGRSSYSKQMNKYKYK